MQGNAAEKRSTEQGLAADSGRAGLKKILKGTLRKTRCGCCALGGLGEMTLDLVLPSVSNPDLAGKLGNH